MRNFYLVLCLLVTVLIILLLLDIHPRSQKSVPCSEQLMSAVTQLVREDFNPFLRFFVEAKNNIVCERGENMANVALHVEKKSGDHYYGIFHIHFSPGTGELNSEGPEIRWKYHWKSLKDGAEWKTDWCDFIRKSYRHEFKKQKCL